MWPANNTYPAVRLWLQQRLAEEPERERDAVIRTVLEWQSGQSRALMLSRDYRFSESQLNQLNEAALRLTGGEPLQHITGYASFFGRHFKVNRHVLIPRPETEELVALCLNLSPKGARALDIGTGSGCIAISLSLEGEHFDVEAWDVSSEALSVAEENALQLGANITFVLRDALEVAPAGPFDLIVSNPPYIALDELHSIDRRVRDHEPHRALFVSKDPLEFYRHIIEQIGDWLLPAGVFAFECHEHHADEVLRLCLASHWVQRASLMNDAQGKPRMVHGERTR